MNLACIGEHTVDLARLTKGGWVLDAGCRDFTFSRGIADKGCRVLAIDADHTVKKPAEIHPDVFFINWAIADEDGQNTLVMSADPQARYLAPSGEGRKVTTKTLSSIMSASGIRHWDVVKLDVEGSEYKILRSWPGPIATQISIEFHEHVRPRPQEMYEEIFHHLGQWYDVVRHEKSARHATHPNFWDTLVCLKGE